MGGGSDSTKATYFKKMKGECEFGYLSHNNGDNVVYCHYEKKVVIQTSKTSWNLGKLFLHAHCQKLGNFCLNVFGYLPCFYIFVL